MIERYDSPDTLFYCDPPYPHESRSDIHAYSFEMSDAEQRDLAAVLHRVQGKVALSGYRSPLMDALYGAWRAVEAAPKNAHSTNTGAAGRKRERVEVLWMNYYAATGHEHDCQSFTN